LAQPDARRATRHATGKQAELERSTCDRRIQAGLARQGQPEVAAHAVAYVFDNAQRARRRSV